MNGIEDLKLMLESRSTDYGKMRQILSWYLLNHDKIVADLRAKLKVAINTLEKISYGDGTLSDFSGLAELTLAEIRAEGGAS